MTSRERIGLSLACVLWVVFCATLVWAAGQVIVG